jgi:glycosyltransferase involved in cell wall biosynthesis
MLRTYKGIVHCHLPQAEIFGNICAGSNSRLVASRHFGGQFYPGVNRSLSTVMSLIFSLRTKKLISISESVRDVLISNREVANVKKIVTVEYGFEIPVNRLNGRGEIYSEHANTNDHLIIGMVSRLSPEKRLELALHAFEQFLGYFPNAELIICGEGVQLSQLQRLSVTLGINSSIRFVGKVSDIQSWYEKFDIFLHTSEFEGFGMVYLEAISNYLPIVTLTSGGVVDSLKDNPGITLVDLPQDSKAVTKSLIKAAKIDRETIRASYDLALTKYDPNCMAKKIERIYTDLT